MSGAEQVQSFNPFIVLIWITNVVVLALDWLDDGRISWSIPVIGSIVIIQVYMIWKTNYDKMMEEERDKQMQALGGPSGVPEIVPGQTNLKNLYKKDEGTKKEEKKSDSTVYLNKSDGEEDS